MNILVLVFGIILAVANGQNLPLPPLPYEYNALEPFIDEATMRVHHLGHHQAYTNKLNEALQELRQDASTKELAKKGVDFILKHLDQVPQRLRGKVQNNGGGFVNHDKFWSIMKAPSDSENLAPDEELLISHAIEEEFKSFQAFKEQFVASGLAVFGSGWVWLVYNQETHALEVTTTKNQDTPESDGKYLIILGLDLWEHAYYLKYQNKRADYIDGWFHLINWQEANRRFLAAAEEATNEIKDEL